MKLELEASHHFSATLSSTCDDDGRGLCGEPAEGMFTYTSGRLELAFTKGPSAHFVYSAVRLTAKGVLEFFHDNTSGSGTFLANRLVPTIAKSTCGGCQDVYTSCLGLAPQPPAAASSCRPKFDQCIYDSTFANFVLAQADCYPREATDEACKRAQDWVRDNDHDAESMKYAKQILSFYGIRAASCPL
jgi:hypothetical protein